MSNQLIGKILVTTAKSRLVEECLTDTKYWIPKTCTFDFNQCDEDGNFLFEVNDWWWRKKDDFIAGEIDEK